MSRHAAEAAESTTAEQTRSHIGEPSDAYLERVPAQSVIAKTLELQHAAKPRNWWRRFWGASPLAPESRSWWQGARGEQRIAQNLRALPGPWWQVAHSVPVGTRGSDIDHVVVAASGVYTINTKYHFQANIWVGGATFMVNGTRQPYIRNSEYEARRVKQSIKRLTGKTVPVHPLIVLVEARRVTIKTPPREVAIVPERLLTKWLARQPPRMPPDDFNAVAAAMPHLDVWAPSEVGPRRARSLEAEFDALTREVYRARRQRILTRLLIVTPLVVFAALWSLGIALGALDMLTAG